MIVRWSEPHSKLGDVREYQGFVGSTLVGKVLSEKGTHSWHVENWLLHELGERSGDDVAPLLLLNDFKRAVEQYAEQWMVLSGQIELPMENISESTSQLVDGIVDDLIGGLGHPEARSAGLERHRSKDRGRSANRYQCPITADRPDRLTYPPPSGLNRLMRSSSVLRCQHYENVMGMLWAQT